MGAPQVTADSIRYVANKKYVEPARARKESSVTIRVGDLHDAMGLVDRVPQVCSALTAGAFEDLYRVTFSRQDGPKQGRTTKLTFGVSP